MRRYVLTLLAAATLVAPVLTGTAFAAPYPTGILCSISAVDDPTTEGASTYEVDAALLLSDGTNPLVLYPGSVSCLVNHGVGVQEFTGPAATGVATAGGTFTVADGSDVSLCTRVDLADGRTLFWDEWERGWSSDDARCWSLVTSTGPVPPLVYEVVGEFIAFYCPVYALVFPPEGDIPGVWDCPPYNG